jgi:signal transduction histidine kinase
MRGMRERAGLIGAELTIERSIHGVGTELRLELPLNGTI